MNRTGRLLAGLATAAAIAALTAVAEPALAQDSQGVTLLRDTEIEGILHQEADPIFTAAGLDAKKVNIHLIDDPTLDAETGAGLNIFINTGLITEAQNPNQLIGVIAHETGHMAAGDVAHSGAMMHSGLGPMLLGIGLGALAAAAGAPGAAAGLVYSGGYFGELNILGYSREQESRADAAAATYLENAGDSGQGLVDFFNNFRYQEVFSDDRKFPYFRTHPLTDERIEALEARVRAEPHFGAKDSPETIAQFEVMKAKLIGFLDAPAYTIDAYPETDTSFPARYARAIAEYKAGDADVAIKKIDALIAERPTDPFLYELEGQVLFEDGKPKEAEAPYRKSVQLDPNAPLLEINLAQTLIAENDPSRLDEAIGELKKAMMDEPENPMGWRLLSEAYDTKGEAGLARLATAEQEFSLGQMKDARIFAMRARVLLKKGTPEWRRATDIFLASNPSKDDMKVLGATG